MDIPRNPRVLRSLLGPAWRGLVKHRGRGAGTSTVRADLDATFDWRYDRSFPELARLHEVAKESQWNAATAIDWSRPVEPRDPARPLLPGSFVPFASLRGWRQGSPAQRAMLTHALTSWLLSQFLHGEQGALFAAAQITEAVPWLDAKLCGSTQVVDEGRHVEVSTATSRPSSSGSTRSTTTSTW